MKNLIYCCAVLMVLNINCTTDSDHVQLLNRKASLPDAFNFQGFGLKVMASFSNHKEKTMSVLYANQMALRNACGIKPTHVPGEIFMLLSWHQQADEHWFGANIPGTPQSAELIKTNPAGGALIFSYQKFSGKYLLPVTDTLGQSIRMKYILDLQPAVMP